MRQSLDINEILARTISLYVFYTFLFTNLYESTQDKPQKSMRSPILTRCPSHSNSFINTLEEGNLGNQAKKDYDFAAATVKLVSGDENGR